MHTCIQYTGYLEIDGRIFVSG